MDRLPKVSAKIFTLVMRGHSRPKDGVASLAYDPRIHQTNKHLAKTMDGRVKPGHDKWMGARE